MQEREHLPFSFRATIISFRSCTQLTMAWTKQQKPPHYLIVFPSEHRELWNDLNKFCGNSKTTKADFIRESIREKLKKDVSSDRE